MFHLARSHLIPFRPRTMKPLPARPFSPRGPRPRSPAPRRLPGPTCRGSRGGATKNRAAGGASPPGRPGPRGPRGGPSRGVGGAEGARETDAWGPRPRAWRHRGGERRFRREGGRPPRIPPGGRAPGGAGASGGEGRAGPPSNPLPWPGPPAATPPSVRPPPLGKGKKKGGSEFKKEGTFFPPGGNVGQRKTKIATEEGGEKFERLDQFFSNKGIFFLRGPSDLPKPPWRGKRPRVKIWQPNHPPSFPPSARNRRRPRPPPARSDNFPAPPPPRSGAPHPRLQTFRGDQRGKPKTPNVFGPPF